MHCSSEIIKNIENNINNINKCNKLVIWGLSGCVYCKAAIEYLNKHKIKYSVFYIDLSPYVECYKKILKKKHPTFPHIIKDNKLIGGYSDLIEKPLSHLRR